MVISKLRKVWEVTPLEKCWILKISLKTFFTVQGGQWRSVDQLRRRRCDRRGVLHGRPPLHHHHKVRLSNNHRYKWEILFHLSLIITVIMVPKVMKNTSAIVKLYWICPRLKPDTDYMARIAIYKDYPTRSLGKSTAVIEFRTSSKFLFKSFFSFLLLMILYLSKF